jgi:hypothetical protein
MVNKNKSKKGGDIWKLFVVYFFSFLIIGLIMIPLLSINLWIALVIWIITIVADILFLKGVITIFLTDILKKIFTKDQSLQKT